MLIHLILALIADPTVSKQEKIELIAGNIPNCFLKNINRLLYN
jgi:hypothetical protein